MINWQFTRGAKHYIISKRSNKRSKSCNCRIQDDGSKTTIMQLFTRTKYWGEAGFSHCFPPPTIGDHSRPASPSGQANQSSVATRPWQTPTCLLVNVVDIPYANHGAGMFTYKTGSFMGQMLVNIAAYMEHMGMSMGWNKRTLVIFFGIS